MVLVICHQESVAERRLVPKLKESFTIVLRQGLKRCNKDNLLQYELRIGREYAIEEQHMYHDLQSIYKGPYLAQT